MRVRLKICSCSKMKTIIHIACFASAAALVFAQDSRKSSPATQPASGTPASAAEVKVPERTTAQKHSGMVYNDAVHVAAAIAYAKSRGATVGEFATFCGDQFASRWNVKAGFVGLVTGMLNFQALCRTDDDPPLEIVDRSESMIRVKGVVRHLRAFAKGSVYGVTRDEFLRWWEVACQRVAARYDCTYTHEVRDGDVMIVTLTKG